MMFSLIRDNHVCKAVISLSSVVSVKPSHAKPDLQSFSFHPSYGVRVAPRSIVLTLSTASYSPRYHGRRGTHHHAEEILALAPHVLSVRRDSCRLALGCSDSTPTTESRQKRCLCPCGGSSSRREHQSSPRRQ